MKKLFMILGTLAVLTVLAGCSNASSDSSNDSKSFTVKEEKGVLYNQEYAESAGFLKDDEGKYYGYIYIITATTKDEYKEYIDTEVFYAEEGSSVGNTFKTHSKDKVEKMLDEGKFKIIDSKSWLGYDAICLNYYPQ